MSLYADYVNERKVGHIIETDKGFATYRFPDEKTVYIVDIYVVPEARRLGAASDIADMVMGLAKQKGCTKMIGSVVPSAACSTQSLRVLLGYGMRLDSSTNDFIIFRRDI